MATRGLAGCKVHHRREASLDIDVHSALLGAGGQDDAVDQAAHGVARVAALGRAVVEHRGQLRDRGLVGGAEGRMQGDHLRCLLLTRGRGELVAFAARVLQPCNDLGNLTGAGSDRADEAFDLPLELGDTGMALPPGRALLAFQLLAVLPVGLPGQAPAFRAEQLAPQAVDHAALERAVVDRPPVVAGA